MNAWTCYSIALAMSVSVMAGSASDRVGAATVQLSTNPASRGALEFAADPGERNEVKVTKEGSTFTATDAGAFLQAGSGCRVVTAHMVVCDPPAITFPVTFVHLGDGDDSAVAGAAVSAMVWGDAGTDWIEGGARPNFLYGGEGDDVIVGGSRDDLLDGDLTGDGSTLVGGNDQLLGGGGRDQLQGGPGDDRLDGQAGDDFLEGDRSVINVTGDHAHGVGADAIAGGPGTDHLMYNFQPLNPAKTRLVAPRLSITLDGQQNDGPPGDRDDVDRDVERAYSLASATLNPLPGGRMPVVQPLSDSKGRPLNTRVGARIYRLARRGTRDSDNALFEGAPFRIHDPGQADRPIEVEPTGGSFRRCRAQSSGLLATAARRASRRTIRRLRVKAKGRYRTRGRNSAATVRGTAWTIAESCDGTLTKVRRGSVKVRDFGRHKTIIVRAGHSYLARPPNTP